MNAMRNLKFAFAALAATAIVYVAAPAPIHAHPEWESWTTYNDGCPLDTFNGYRNVSCWSAVDTYGTLSGHWKRIDYFNCETGQDLHEYYELQNGVYVQVTQAFYEAGQCS